MMVNELAKSNSPYLLAHKDNPISWKIWNENNIISAKERDIPIFLSIGYFTCHWCHVMAREVFEDEEVAKIMNDNFVCIKLDREENPDIDSFYINALSILQNGNAGWPANLFLTPDLKPFFGFTYLPKEKFLKVVKQIIKMWKEDKGELLDYAEKVYSYLKNNYLEKLQLYPDVFLELNNLENFLFEIDRSLYNSLDSNGGFGFRPKFPPHQILEYLLLRFEDTPSKFVLECIDKTLSNMILGGMYDVVDGGFCRYSVDENWMVPHFEKMLYDNAILLFLYIKASQIFKRIDLNKSKLFENVGMSIFDFLVSFLYKEGAFCSSLSAESNDNGKDEEGAYYLFKSDQLKNIENFNNYFSTFNFINPHTNYSGLIVHFKQFPNYEEINKIQEIRLKLKNIRNQKNKPYLDNKIILSWNCMLVYYLLKSYEISNYLPFLEISQNVINRLLGLFKNGRLYRLKVNDEIYGDAVLEDYLWFSLCLFYYYTITREKNYLELSVNLFNSAKEKFFRDGVFYNSEKLLSFDIFDNSIHSNNSIAILLEFVLNYDLKDDLKKFILKVFNFCENHLYLGSFLYFLCFYKIENQKFKSIMNYSENCKVYFESIDSGFEIKPQFIELENNAMKEVSLNVCGQGRCFVVNKKFFIS